MSEKQFYIVNKDVVPEIMLKVLEAKKILLTGTFKTVKEVTEHVGISRSVYYKYQDAIEPYYEKEVKQTLTISMNLTHEPGILSNVINCISQHHANILTLNQTIPIRKIANITVTIELNNKQDKDILIQALKDIEGATKVKVVATSKIE